MTARTLRTRQRMLLALLARVMVLLAAHPAAGASASAPVPASAPTAAVAVSANVTGSLGNLCSSLGGVLQLTQGAAAGQNTAGINVTIPATLNNAAAVPQIAQIAWEYIYSYPLPIVAGTLVGGSANGTGSNSFYAHVNHLSTPNDTGVVAPNHDTVYGSAFLDLSQGNQIVTVPAFDSGRYWIVPFLDAYTNFYSSIGSHNNSTAGDYLVLGRDAPANTTYGNFTSERIIHAPTDINWLIARVLVFNDSDTATAASLLDAITVRPYNASASNSSIASSRAEAISRTVSISAGSSNVNGNQIALLTALSAEPALWFNTTAAYTEIDPPGTGLGTLDMGLATLAATAKNASALTLAAFQVADQIATQCITQSHVGYTTLTGWSFNNGATYGTDYLSRAKTARGVLGQLPPSEAIYLTTSQDSQNQTLDASTGHNYTVTFPLPVPADAFWSITLYNATNVQLVSNSINRYSIGDRTPGLVYGGAGNSTLQVFISAQQPAASSPQLANWLPAPNDAPFELIVRLYEPQSLVLAGDYEPPAVVRHT